MSQLLTLASFVGPGRRRSLRLAVPRVSTPRIFRPRGIQTLGSCFPLSWRPELSLPSTRRVWSGGPGTRPMGRPGTYGSPRGYPPLPDSPDSGGPSGHGPGRGPGPGGGGGQPRDHSRGPKTKKVNQAAKTLV